MCTKFCNNRFLGYIVQGGGGTLAFMFSSSHVQQESICDLPNLKLLLPLKKLVKVSRTTNSREFVDQETV